MVNSLLPTGSFLEYTIRFFLFVLIFLFPLGNFVLQISRAQIRSQFEKILLTLLLGTLLATTIYFFLRYFNQENSFVPVILGIGVAWLYLLIREKKKLKISSVKQLKEPQVLYALIIFGAIFLYNFGFNIGGFQWLPDGGLYLKNTFYSDYIWKLSIMSELEHTVPPQIPVFAGHRLSYHYFSELFGVLVTIITKIDILSIRFYVIPIFSFALLSGFTYLLLRRLFQNHSLALLGFSLFMLAPKTYKFSAIPHIPIAISIFFAVILLFAQMPARKRIGHLILPVILIAHLLMFESLLSLCFIASFFLGAGILYMKNKRLDYLVAVTLGFLLALTLAWFALGRFGAGQGFISVNFPFFIQAVRELPPMFKGVFKDVLAAYQAHFSEINSELMLKIALIPLLFLYAVAVSIFTQIQFALLALKELFRRAKNIMKEPIASMFISIAALIGFLFPMFISISFFWGASFRIFAVARHFLYAFSAPVAVKLWNSKNPFHKGFLLVFIVFFLVLPNMKNLQNRFERYPHYAELSGDKMEIFDYLRTQTPRDSVLMHPFIDDPIRDPKKNDETAWVFEDHYYYGSALGGRRVVLEGSIEGPALQMVPITLDHLKQIRKDMKTIYSTKNTEEAAQLLLKHRTDYLWVSVSKPLQFNAGRLLSPVKSNKSFILYQVNS